MMTDIAEEQSSGTSGGLDSSSADAVVAEAKELLESDNDNNDDDDDAAAVAVVSSILEKTIHTMAATQLCVHPEHSHSFSKVSFTTFFAAKLRKCAGCTQPFNNKNNKNNNRAVFGGDGDDIVKCVACGAFAHRFCALSAESTWKDPCPVNGTRIQEAAAAAADRARIIVTEEEDQHEEEYEMELKDDNHTTRYNIRRINSAVSSASGDSMESQELNHEEDEEMPTGAEQQQQQQQELQLENGRNSLGGEDKLEGRKASAEENTATEPHDPQGIPPQSPTGLARRPVLSSLLRTMKGSKDEEEEKNEDGNHEKENAHQQNKSNDQAAFEGSERDSDAMTPTTKRAWLSLRNLKAAIGEAGENDKSESFQASEKDPDHMSPKSKLSWLSLRNLTAKSGSVDDGNGEETKSQKADKGDTDESETFSDDRRGSWFQLKNKYNGDTTANELLESSPSSRIKPPSMFGIFAKKSDDNSATPERSENSDDSFRDAREVQETENYGTTGMDQFSMFSDLEEERGEHHSMHDHDHEPEEEVHHDYQNSKEEDTEPERLLKTAKTEGPEAQEIQKVREQIGPENDAQEEETNTRGFSLFRRTKNASNIGQNDDDDEIVNFTIKKSDVGQAENSGLFEEWPVTLPGPTEDEDVPSIPDNFGDLQIPQQRIRDNEACHGEHDLLTTAASSTSMLRIFSRKDCKREEEEATDNCAENSNHNVITSPKQQQGFLGNIFKKSDEHQQYGGIVDNGVNDTYGRDAVASAPRKLSVSNIFHRSTGPSQGLPEIRDFEKGGPRMNSQSLVQDSQKDGEENDEGKPSLFSRVFTSKTNSAVDVPEPVDTVQPTEDVHVERTEQGPRLLRLFSKKDVNDRSEAPNTDSADCGGHKKERADVSDTGQTAPRKFSLFSSFRSSSKEGADASDSPDLAQAWSSEQPPSRWKTTTTTSFHSSNDEQNGNSSKGGEDGEEPSSEPLHYANHPFASVSRALQDNILAVWGNGNQPEAELIGEVQEGEKDVLEGSPRKPKATLSLIVAPEGQSPPEAPESQSPPEEEVDIKTKLGEVRPEPVHESTLKKLVSGTYETVKAVTWTRKKMGMASVAGGIAGGVAGLMFAGPAGAVMGIRYGQTAGMLGVVLEGSLTVGVVVAGITGGRLTAEKIQEQMKEQRVLTIGEQGVSRKVMLVRPEIRIDPAWHNICRKAQRTSPSSQTSSFSFRLFSGTQDIKHERYEKTSDIVETEEEEIPKGEKVLLLVSRVLSDKESFPGHVYRCLMQTFRERCEKRSFVTAEEKGGPFAHCATSRDPTENEPSVSSRERREDAHAVIKYITATLLQVRPGLSSTPQITETTASVVEALVFGEIYDLVYEEIALEATERDKDLIEKIDDFEYDRFERICVPLETEGIISKRAICELRRLPDMHSAADKLRHCVAFLEMISDHFSSASKTGTAMGADSLLKMVCQHIIAAKMPNINAEIAFLEEFARDEQLLRGKEGYALVTLQASLHFLNMSADFGRDIFGQDNDEENIPIEELLEKKWT